jgi:hypothetical protein
MVGENQITGDSIGHKRTFRLNPMTPKLQDEGLHCCKLPGQIHFPTV